MKDYERLVIWTDYFNSSNSRKGGRRVPLNVSVRNPTLDELQEASKRAGYEPSCTKAFYPKHVSIESGYVSIKRAKSKVQMIKEISRLLSTIRGESRKDNRTNKS